LKATFYYSGREASPSRVDGGDDSPPTQCSKNWNAVSRNYADRHTGLLTDHCISFDDGKPTFLIWGGHLFAVHLLWTNRLREKAPVRHGQAMIDIAL